MKQFLLLSLFSLLAFGSTANNTSLLNVDGEDSFDAPVVADITFCVDLSCFPAADAVAVAGTFNSFNPGINFLSDPDGDGVYCGTVNVPDGPQEFKFFFAQEQFEDLTQGDPCTVTNSGVTNRVINVVAGVPQTVTYGWETCEEQCVAAAAADITFCVDLSCFPAADAVAVGGTFNGFNPGVNFLSDPDGDGTYCGTFAIPEGPQEFLFFFAQEQYEDMVPGDPCTVTNFGFTNRFINVVAGVPQTVTYGWETCEAECEAAATTDITFCVDLSCFPVADAVAVAGTFNSFNPGVNFLADPDGDGIYCGTFGIPAGPQEFIFFFAQQQFENLTPGSPCTVTNFGFTNRFINVVQGVPQTVTYGWESCDATCALPPSITFCVDLNCSGLNPSTVNIFGAFNGWSPVANPMFDPDGDGTYCTTILMPPGNQEYLFLVNGVAESFEVGAPCTVSCCGGQFTNRLIVVESGQDQEVSFDWESCEDTCGDFPFPWEQAPDGIGCPEGSNSEYDAETGTFTLESVGCYSGNYSSDAAAYIKSDLCGNGEVIVRVTSISPYGLGWAGITMRESDAPGSKKIALSTNLSNFARREVRVTTNGFAFPQQFFRPGAYWLRLVRNGNQFVGFMSTNGFSWQTVMAANISMSSCIQVGMFVTNYNGSTVTATFDNVTVSGANVAPLNSPSINPGVATGDEFGTVDFSILPNPASSEVYLDLQDYYGQNAEVHLLNNLGNVIQTRQIREVGSNREKFDLQGLANGIYFIRVRTDQGEISKRLLIVD